MYIIYIYVFKDASKNHVFYNAIVWGAQKKVTTGYK